MFGGGLVPFFLVAYLLGELWLFTVVAGKVGFILAVLLALAKSALGIALVGMFMRKAFAAARRSGGLIVQMRGGSLGRGLAGALFLVLPGFLSAAVAAALLLPTLFGARPADSAADGVLELGEDEWREVEEARLGQRVRRNNRPGGSL